MIRVELPPQLRRRQVLRIATVGALAVLAAEVIAVFLPFIGTKPRLFGGRTIAVGRKADLLERFRKSGDRPIPVHERGGLLSPPRAWGHHRRPADVHASNVPGHRVP